MNIGEFNLNKGRMMGWIATRTIDLPKLGLRPVESQNELAPVYEILALNVGDRWVQVGALWEAIAKKTGEAAGRRNYRAQLVCERLTGRPADSYSNAAMEWGTVTEPLARLAFEERTGEVVNQIGFIRVFVFGTEQIANDRDVAQAWYFLLTVGAVITHQPT